MVVCWLAYLPSPAGAVPFIAVDIGGGAPSGLIPLSSPATHINVDGFYSVGPDEGATCVCILSYVLGPLTGTSVSSVNGALLIGETYGAGGTFTITGNPYFADNTQLYGAPVPLLTGTFLTAHLTTNMYGETVSQHIEADVTNAVLDALFASYFDVSSGVYAGHMRIDSTSPFILGGTMFAGFNGAMELDPVQVPEAPALALVVLGLIAIAVFRRRFGLG